MSTPAPVLSPDLVKRLTYSKYLLRRAISLQREGNELAAAEGVLVAHDAAEMLMRVVTDSLSVTYDKQDRFMDFWKKVKDPPPPHKSTMERFNRLRVDFKHLGTLPHPGVVTDLLPVVTAFCHEIAGLYLRVDFETISLADLIPNEEARAKIKEAETSFEKGELEDALLALSLAYNLLFKQAGEKFGFLKVQGRDELLPGFTRGLRALVRSVNLLSMGINPIRAQRAAMLMPGIARSPFSDSVQVEVWREPTIEDFEFCRDYVVDFGIRLARID